MNEKQTVDCPEPGILKDFLQGRLEPPNLSACESHIADCQRCHETLRGLNVDDTLSQYVSGALDDLSSQEFSLAEALAGDSNNPESLAISDSLEIKSLVERLMNPNELALHPTHCIHQTKTPRPRPSQVEAELLADRAAEILRYVEPTEDEDTLGTLGDYLLVKLIGAGSTGVVFHAIEQSLDRSVALKVLRPSLGAIARERFVAEARVAASIEHPNVVTIYQVGQQERLAFIAMQWLPGQTLDEMLATDADMDEVEIRRIASQVAAGLSAAHHKQLVHRDIKPANLWVCEGTGEIKILDFGLARIADDDPGLTATGMLAGTPNFMSPEQARGLELDGRSDLFSLGCVMYRLLTGRLPFGSPTVLATLQSIQSDQPTPPKSFRPDISESLSDLTMSLLEKQPPNRPASADQLIEMLKLERNDWPTSVIRYKDHPQAIQGVLEPGSQPALMRTPSISLPNNANSNIIVSHTTLAPKQKSLAADYYFWRWFAATILGLLGLSAAWYSPQIIRIVNDEGEIVIETSDDSIEVILTDGDLVQVLDTKTKKSFNIRSGNYEIKAREKGETGSGETNTFKITPNTLTMSRGSQQVVTVTKSGKDSQANAISDIDALKDLLPTNKILESLRILDREIAQSKAEKTNILETYTPNHPLAMRAVSTLEAKQQERAALEALLKSHVDKMDANLRNSLNEKSEPRFTRTEKYENGKFTTSYTPVEIESAAFPAAKGKAFSNSKVPNGLIANSASGSSKGSLETGKIFNGHDLEHWLYVAERDLDSATAADAIKASSKLAGNKIEKQRLLKVASVLLRRQRKLPPQGMDDKTPEQFLYANAFMQAEPELFQSLLDVFSVLEPKQVIEFVKGEIEHGNRSSRNFCINLVTIGTIYKRDQAMQKQHWECLVDNSVELLNSMDQLAQEGMPSTALLYVFAGNLPSPQWNAPGLGPNESFDEIRKQIHQRAPDLLPWVSEKFDNLKSSDSPSRDPFWRLLATLSNVKDNPETEQFAGDMWNEFFDPATSPARREELYTWIPSFDLGLGEEANAKFLAMVLSDQFPNKVSIQTIVPAHVLKNNFDLETKPRLRFTDLETLEFDRNGIHNDAPITGWPASGATGEGGWGAGTARPEIVTGAPAVIRKVLNSLWTIESSLTKEFKDAELVPFLESMVKQNEDVADPDLKRLKIFVDLKALIVRAGNGRAPHQQKTGKGGLDEDDPILEVSPFITQLRIKGRFTAHSNVEATKENRTEPEPSLAKLAASGMSLSGLEPIFNGNNFAHWMSIAERDRHPQSMADALVACEALAKDKAEQAKVDELVIKLVREHGKNSIGGTQPSDIYVNAAIRVLDSRTPNQVVEFILTEVSEGTSKSRQFCSLLLSGVSLNDDGMAVIARMEEFGSSSKAIYQAIEAIPSSPEREMLFSSFVGTVARNGTFDRDLAQQLEERILNGDDKKSLELFKITEPIFAKSKAAKVYQRIDNILFGKDTTPTNRDIAFALIAGETIVNGGVFGFMNAAGQFQDEKLASLLKLLEVQFEAPDALKFSTMYKFLYTVEGKTKSVHGRIALIRRLTTAIVRNTEGNIRPEQSAMLLRTLAKFEKELTQNEFPESRAFAEFKINQDVQVLLARAKHEGHGELSQFAQPQYDWTQTGGGALNGGGLF